jgi:hypothetical protein
MSPEPGVAAPQRSGKSETLIKAVTERAAKPSVFIENKEESPES